MKHLKTIGLLLSCLLLLTACTGETTNPNGDDGGEPDVIAAESLEGFWYDEDAGYLVEIAPGGGYRVFERAVNEAYPVTVTGQAIEIAMPNLTEQTTYVTQQEDLILLYPESNTVYRRLDRYNMPEDIAETVGIDTSSLPLADEDGVAYTQYYNKFDFSSNEPEKVVGVWQDQTFGSVLWFSPDATVLNFSRAVEYTYSIDGSEMTVKAEGGELKIYEVEFKDGAESAPAAMTLSSVEQTFKLKKI